MIIDYNYPNLTAEGWCVNVHKAQKDGRVFVLKMKFENKDDAFAYYLHVRQVWKNQGKTR